MVCKHCGNELPEDAKFCPFCGNKVEEEVVQEEFFEEVKENSSEEEKEEFFEEVKEEFFDEVKEESAPAQVFVDTKQEAAAKTEIDREKQSAEGRQALTFAILSLAFGVVFACSYMFAVLEPLMVLFLLPGNVIGLIFSIKAKKMLNAYKDKYGSVSGAAAVARGLATGGMIVNIVVLGLFVFGFMIGLGVGVDEVIEESLYGTEF